METILKHTWPMLKRCMRERSALCSCATRLSMKAWLGAPRQLHVHAPASDRPTQTAHQPHNMPSALVMQIMCLIRSMAHLRSFATIKAYQCPAVLTWHKHSTSKEDV